jgi:hypothetical protein
MWIGLAYQPATPLTPGTEAKPKTRFRRLVEASEIPIMMINPELALWLPTTRATGFGSARSARERR